jgi:hypothetical protein
MSGMSNYMQKVISLFLIANNSIDSCFGVVSICCEKPLTMNTIVNHYKNINFSNQL